MTAKQAIALLAAEVKDLKARVAVLEANASGGIDEELGEIPGLDGSGSGVGASSPASRAAGSGEAPAPVKARIEDPPGSGQWSYAPATAAQKALRERLLLLVALENLPAEWNISKEDAEAAFLKGGPLWLYDIGRDYVMGLPPSTRAGFVQDVNMIDPEEAALLSRDLLKVWDEEQMLGPEDAIDRDKQWRARGGSAVAGAYGTSS